jgi:hypothetical protein
MTKTSENGLALIRQTARRRSGGKPKLITTARCSRFIQNGDYTRNGLADLDGFLSIFKKIGKVVGKAGKFIPGVGQAIDVIGTGVGVVKGIKNKKKAKQAEQAALQQQQAEQQAAIARQRNELAAKMEGERKANETNYLTYIAIGGGGLALLLVYMMMRK